MSTDRLSDGLVAALSGEGVARAYPSGATLFAEGDPPGPTLLVLTGQVDIILASGDVLNSAGPGELVGDLSAVDAQPRSASAVARTDVEVRAIAPGRFVELLDEQPELTKHLLWVLVARLRRNVVTIDTSGQYLPVDRLAAWILAQPRDDVWVDLSLGDVSDALGSSRELVSRAIDHLVGRGAVALERGRLLVRSDEELRALAGPAAG
jgi:CRP-like cAMP-binding protein